MATNDLYPSDLDMYKVRLVEMDFSDYAGSATVYYNDGTYKWAAITDTRRLVKFCQDKCIAHVRVAIASTKFNVQYELEGNERGVLLYIDDLKAQYPPQGYMTYEQVPPYMHPDKEFVWCARVWRSRSCD